jgi:Delta3,5-Delta2,4-dienoyl-CoA isomerase
VSECFADRKTMMEHVLKLAATISSKSPIAIAGTKKFLVHSLDHTTAEGLERMTEWNSVMLQTEDVTKATMAFFSKQAPIFSKL